MVWVGFYACEWLGGEQGSHWLCSRLFPDYFLDAGLLSPDAKHITRYTFKEPGHSHHGSIRCTALEVLQCHGGSSFSSEGKCSLAVCRLPSDVGSLAADNVKDHDSMYAFMRHHNRHLNAAHGHLGSSRNGRSYSRTRNP